MDFDTIKALLEKYWEGETSLQEEARLKAYFGQENIDPRFGKEAELFRFYESEGEKRIESEDFDSTVLEQLEPKAKVVSLRSRFVKYAMGIAASLLLLLTVYPSMEEAINPQSRMAMEDSYDTPEEAYEATKKALLLVSRKLNKGTSKAAAGLTKVNEATEIFHLD